MSVTDFECAIAKSQIGRYIAGDNLAPEVARQLENHIDNCPRCKQLLQEKKNSLEAMISHQGEVETPTIQIKNEPVAMTRPATDGSSALKPDFMEVLADSARTSLREKLKESARTKTETFEVSAVAPAFAYKDAEPIETVSIPAEKPKKKGFLSAFALFENVPDEQPKPSLSAENIRSAKAVFRENNQSLRKPMMYMAGLCCVVAAMSFVLRDPTTLFGGKAAKGSVASAPATSKNTTKISKKPTAKVAKVLPHKPAQLNDQGVDSQTFTDEEPTATAKPKATAKQLASPAGIQANKLPSAPKQFKPKLTKAKPLAIKPATTEPLAKKPAAKVAKAATKPALKTVVKPKAKPLVKTAAKPVAKATSAQHFAAKPKAKHVRHSASKPAPANENSVKLYTNDPTPTPKEQK